MTVVCCGEANTHPQRLPHISASPSTWPTATTSKRSWVPQSWNFGCKSWFYHFWAVWTWANQLLRPCILICKMAMRTEPTAQDCWGEEINPHKEFSSVPAHCKLTDKLWKVKPDKRKCWWHGGWRDSTLAKPQCGAPFVLNVTKISHSIGS